MPVRFRSPLATLFALVALGGATVAAAQSANPGPGASALPAMTLTATYVVYGGGMALYEADATVTVLADRFQARLEASPRGIAGLLGGSRHTVESEGRVTADGAVVERSFVHRDFGDRAKTTLIDYRDRPTVAVTDVPERGAHTAIEPAILAETVDPLTAILDGLLAFTAAADPAAACAGTRAVFDGRRAIDIALSPRTPGAVPRSRVALYEGPTARCDAAVAPLDGDFEDGRDTFWEADPAVRTVTIHVARPLADGPVLPVRLEGETRAGAFRVHLTALTLAAPRPAGLAFLPDAAPLPTGG